MDTFFYIGIVCWIVVTVLWTRDRIRRRRRKRLIWHDCDPEITRGIEIGSFGNDPDFIEKVQYDHRRLMGGT